jgi:alpha-1,3-rhamnosyltransferase
LHGGINNQVQMMSSKVSVIITSFNHVRYIKKSISSAAAQGYKNKEIIVIDDGSSDGSKAIIDQLVDEYKFSFLAHENMGVCKTLNKAITQFSSGKYIALLASDDYYHPDKIAEQVRMLEANPDAELCYRQAIEFDDATGAEIRTFPARPVVSSPIKWANRN